MYIARSRPYDFKNSPYRTSTVPTNVHAVPRNDLGTILQISGDLTKISTTRFSVTYRFINAELKIYFSSDYVFTYFVYVIIEVSMEFGTYRERSFAVNIKSLLLSYVTY